MDPADAPVFDASVLLGGHPGNLLCNNNDNNDNKNDNNDNK